MKVQLVELEAMIKHIKDNSFDSIINIREDSQSIKVTVGSKTGSLIDYEIYSDELNTFAKVRESKELCLKHY